jgi:YVTN family beta-propeller protein
MLFAASAVAAAVLLLAAAGSARRSGGSPVALVTAEYENELFAVSLPGGRVLRRVRLHNPRTVAAGVAGPAVVVSPSGTVTLLSFRTLRPLAVLRGFRSPQIAAIAPDGEHAFVTDDASGYLSVIGFAQRRVVGRVLVGVSAHHLAISPDQQRVWVALGEHASTIVVVDTHALNRPRVVRRLRTRVPAHDLAFAPDGRTVWVTSAKSAYVSVLNAQTGRLVATVPAGPPPQHIVFLPYRGARAYITSGYGSTIEMVDVHTGKVLRRTRVPYGSFNVATAGDLVVTASLLNGTVTEFDGSKLSKWMTVKVAPNARTVAISVW